MDKGRILVVDDDALFRTVCSDMLTANGYAVKLASKGHEAINLIESEDFDIVITDLIMPDVSGLDVLQRTKQRNTLIDVIVVTGHSSVDTAVEALKNGAFDYVRKPLNEDELILAVTSCMEKKKLLEENSEMRQSLKLFEVSKTVLTTIDITKLYNVSLDALLQIIHAEAGILVFYGDGGKDLEIKALRNIGFNEAESVIRVFKERFENDLKEIKSVLVVPPPEAGTDAPNYGSTLVAPVVRARRPPDTSSPLADGTEKVTEYATSRTSRSSPSTPRPHLITR